MAFQFPASPVVGQTYTPSAGITFKWNGTAWYLVNSTLLTPTEADTRYVQIANARSMESRIINGNFAIDQRWAGATIVVSSNGYAADRWQGVANGGGTFQQRRAPYGSGFALASTVATVDSSLAAGDFYLVSQSIEANQLSDMYFGSPDGLAPSPFTFSCHIHCSLANATLPIAFRGASTMSYVKTVPLVGGWNFVSFTVPGPTSGAWALGNAKGLEVTVGLGVGSTFHAPVLDAWQAGNFFGAAGCTNVMATAGAIITLREARLYPGSIDYGPCQRLYADELRLCQRYFEKSYDVGTVPGTPTAFGAEQVRQWVAATNYTYKLCFTVPKRAAPTMTAYSYQTGATGMWRNNTAGTDVAMTLAFPSETGCFAEPAAAAAAGTVFAGHWTASAEL